MRRLFFTFASGAPGVGLLLLRILTGSAVLAGSYTLLVRHQLALPMGLMLAAVAGLGVLILAGLWTPVAGGLIALVGIGNALVHPADRVYSVIIGVLGLVLSLLGPGAWSIDARLFGWRRL
jgi:putative oxidoreductase